MKICAFADVHGDLNAVQNVKEEATQSDVLVGAGDFSVFGNNLNEVLREIDDIGKPVMAIHGNHESHSVMQDATVNTENIKVLHKDHHNIDDILFMGYGGGGFSRRYDDFTTIEQHFQQQMEQHPSVFLIHGPPYKTNVDRINNEHVGNETVRNFIDETQPNVVICGHLHENFGIYDILDDTYVVNPGPHGRIIDLDEHTNI